MKIIGLDISGGYATAVLLEERPRNLLEFARSKHFHPFIVEANREDLEALCNLKPDLVVLEPSGLHYEQIFCNWFERNEIEYKKASVKRLANYRNENGLDKTDDRDSLALAAYGFDKLNDKNAFIPKCELADLRQLWLKRYGLIKLQKRIIQRIRLQLQHEFPEAAEANMRKRWGQNTIGPIGWMCNQETRKNKWQKLHDGGIVSYGKPSQHEVQGTIGNGLSEYTRTLAKHCWEIWEQCAHIEEECDRILAEPRFAKYIAAFDDIGLNPETRVIWLTRIYPFERFLGDDGRPRVIRRLSRNGKQCKYDQSLAQFKASLGCGTIKNESGIRQSDFEKIRKRKGWRGKSRLAEERTEFSIGDRFSRTAFFMWGLGQLERRQLKSPEAKKILAKQKKLKEEGTNVYQRLANLQGYTARILYRKLVKS